jgi:hypothetical protein
LSAILAELDSLSNFELEVLIRTASALKENPKGQKRGGKGGGASKKKNTSGQSKTGPTKQPKQAKPAQVSVYQDDPDYQAFKAADKAIRTLCKEFNTNLVGLKSMVDGSKEIPGISEEKGAEDAMTRIVSSLSVFETRRDAWFRAKGRLQASSASSAAGASSATAAPANPTDSAVQPVSPVVPSTENPTG